MATLEHKKLEILERLINSNNEELFDKVKAILDQEEPHFDPVPEEHYRLLMEDRKKYQKGELETYTWDEVEQRMKKKYD